MRFLSSSKISLTTKLIVASAVVEAVLLTFLVWNNTNYAQRRLTLQKQEEITEFSEFISATLASALSRDDQQEIQEIMAQLDKAPNINHAAIMTLDNQIIAQTGTAKQTTLHGLNVLKSKITAYADAYGMLIPLEKNRVALGQLRLEFNTEDINVLVMKVHRQGVFLALLILAGTVVILYLLLTVLTRNIRVLTLAMTEYIDRKNVSATISYSNDEVGKLGRTFDKLIETIRNQEDSLRESQALLQAILDNSPAVIFAKDTAGRYLLVNKAFTRFLNKNASEILGKTDFELFPADVAAKLQENDKKALNSQSIEQLEELVPNGREMKTSFTIKFCLFDKNKDAYAICGISTDITDRIKNEQRLKESEENLRSLANNAIDGILVNKNGTHVFTNQRMADILNTTVDEIVGSPQDFVLHPSEKDNVVQRFKRRLEGQTEPIQYETLFVDKKTGDPVPVELTAFICQWDGERSGVVFVRDIKERKQIEAELKRYREQLEQMVSERTHELESAVRELESFSYSVSHDLRSPLRSIDGFSQLLLEDYQDRLDENGIGYLARVRKSAQRMAQLIDDILLLSRVSRHKLSVARVNLSDIAQESVAVLKELQPQRTVNARIDPNMKAKGDRRLLRIVMDNLLDNAWKYTSKCEQAEIHVGSKRENGSTVYFVKDNGVGFDMQYVDKLFGAFQRLHGTDDFPGTGIGLATVKRIIDRHNGKVWAESRPGEGATFYFKLH